MREIESPLTEVANGVLDRAGRFFPYQHITLSASQMTWKPPGKGRIFVKSGYLLIREEAGDTASFCTVSGDSQNGMYVDSLLYQDFLVGAMAVPMQQVRDNINILLDYGAGIALVKDGILHSYWASITLAVIDYG